MNVRELKDRVYDELAAIAKALSNPHRMEILDVLVQGAFPVEAIAKHTNMSVANTSQHLQTMKSNRLVKVDRQGNFIFYSLYSTKVYEAWVAIRELGFETSAEIERTIADYRKSDPILIPTTAKELMGRIEAGEVILLDVRPEEEYNRGHFHNALSMPLDQLRERIHELSKEVEIVAYCRGALCVMSDEAVTFLEKQGFKVKKLINEIPYWLTNKLSAIYN
jgi:rhodanese-related sulfurtransferase